MTEKASDLNSYESALGWNEELKTGQLRKEHGMDALAITDHGNMFGVLKFFFEAKKAGIKPIIGCEVYVAEGSRFDKQGRGSRSAYHLILLAKNIEGYKN